MAAQGFSVVIDQRREGGYTAWSTDDDDLKVEVRESPGEALALRAGERYAQGHVWLRANGPGAPRLEILS